MIIITISSRDDFAQKFSQRKVDVWISTQKKIFILIKNFSLYLLIILSHKSS
jgi:hypothetical protein